MISSGDLIKKKRANVMNGGYVGAFEIDDRVNVSCSILEIPQIGADLIGHKVIISDGVSSTDGIVIRRSFIYFMFKTSVFYAKGSTIYLLNEKYQQGTIKSIYVQFQDMLNQIIKYVKTIRRAAVDISVLIVADYETLAGTTSLSDELEDIFRTALAAILKIEKTRILVTEISPGIVTEISPGIVTEISPGIVTEISPGIVKNGIIIKFTIMESPIYDEQTSIDIIEELRFQLSDINSAIYKDEFIKNIVAYRLEIKIHDLSTTDIKFDFMRDYALRLYERIVNERLDVIGNMFNNLSINFVL